MAYCANQRDGFRQVGIYTGRILKGEAPSDLPVMQATKFDLVINLKTAKGLGLNLPLPLLGRPDELVPALMRLAGQLGWSGVSGRPGLLAGQLGWSGYGQSGPSLPGAPP